MVRPRGDLFGGLEDMLTSPAFLRGDIKKMPGALGWVPFTTSCWHCSFCHPVAREGSLHHPLLLSVQVGRTAARASRVQGWKRGSELFPSSPAEASSSTAVEFYSSFFFFDTPKNLGGWSVGQVWPDPVAGDAADFALAPAAVLYLQLAATRYTA